MKKIVLMLMMAVAAISAHAQKYALIDMEYILKNVPAYERANEQLNQVSRKWQAEVEALNTEASTMYKNYQNEVVFLSQEQKKAKQDENLFKSIHLYLIIYNMIFLCLYEVCLFLLLFHLCLGFSKSTLAVLITCYCLVQIFFIEVWPEGITEIQL